MKIKQISVSLLICFIFFSTVGIGCAKNSAPDTSPEYKFGTDYQYQNGNFIKNAFITETEESIYYVEEYSSYLHVIDKKTMTDSVLCGKPNCLHDSDDEGQSDQEKAEQCNGFIEYLGNNGLSYYKGSLYTVCLGESKTGFGYTYELTKISLDGHRRKNVWTIEWDDDYLGQPWETFIHRGKVFFMISPYKTNVKMPDGVEYAPMRIYSYDLSSKELQRIYEANEERNDGGFWHMYALGNDIYATYVTKSEEVQQIGMVRVNLSTKEITYFDGARWIAPIGDKLVSHFAFISKGQEEDEYLMDHKVTVANLDGTNEQIYDALDFANMPYGDKQIQSDGTLLFMMDSYDDGELRVYDFATGEQIGELDMPWFSYEGLRVMSCTREGKLVLYSPLAMMPTTKPCEFFYCDISTIGTPDFQWYEVEKVN